MHFKKKLVDKLLGIVVPTFGEKIEYLPCKGGVKTIYAVFDNDFEIVDPDTEALVSSNNPRIGIRLRDLDHEPRVDDRVKVIDTGKLYTVIDTQEDGQGGSTLVLHELLKDAPKN